MKFTVVVFLLCFCVTVLSAGRLFIDIPSYSTPCTPPKGDICMEIRKCPFFDDLLNRSPIPRPRSVIKVIRDRQCGFVRSTPYVCCDRPTPPPPPETTESMTLSPSIFAKYTNLKDHTNINLLPNDICGPIMTNSRITYGTNTEVNEYPWMALIVYDTDDGVDFRCAGTLIADRYVLTAAHCIIESVVIGVRLGEHDLDTKEDCNLDGSFCAPPPQDIYIENIKIHQEYNPKTYANDIALIRLDKPANFSYSNVQPVCLPMEDIDLKGKFAIVTGWGVTENGRRSSRLKKVSLPVLPTSECLRRYRRIAPITSKQICAGGKNAKDSCGGDSGGPMMYVGLIEGTPRIVQHGIVSYGPRQCGADGQPGIYTRVSKYLGWILDNLEPSLED